MHILFWSQQSHKVEGDKSTLNPRNTEEIDFRVGVSLGNRNGTPSWSSLRQPFFYNYFK